MNCNKDGHNSGHVHPGCDWSAVIYLTELPVGKGGRLILSEPRAQRMMANEVYRKNERPLWAFKRVKIRPRSGWVAVFPSWLWHETEPSTVDRWSLAANLKAIK